MGGELNNHPPTFSHKHPYTLHMHHPRVFVGSRNLYPTLLLHVVVGSAITCHVVALHPEISAMFGRERLEPLFSLQSRFVFLPRLGSKKLEVQGLMDANSSTCGNNNLGVTICYAYNFMLMPFSHIVFS